MFDIAGSGRPQANRKPSSDRSACERTNIRDQEKVAKAKEGNRTTGARRADQIRKVGQTGVFT
jgi:hypothetical protein